MLDSKVSKIALTIALTLVALMWLVNFIDVSLNLSLYQFGIFPLHVKGLIGIVAAPFIHSTDSLAHLFNNSLPTLILTWLLFYHYRLIAPQVFLIIYFLTGVSMWLLARETYHVGMSGVIYGLTSFLVISGFFRKNMRVAAVSLFVVFIYGSLIWGIFPIEPNISWEGHTLGFFSGIIVAVLYKNSGPQPQKMIYEIQEELGIHDEEEYWKESDEEVSKSLSNEQQAKDEGKSIEIRYNYKPKNEQ